MGRYLFAGNFNTMGSGYQTILEALGTELAGQGHEVWILGHKWNRGPHEYPFTVIPSDINWIPAQAANLTQVLDFEAVIVAMDIPRIGHMVNSAEMFSKWQAPSIGLFPVESTPILPTWAAALGAMDGLCTISQFGKRALLQEYGLDATWLPMTARIPEGVPTKEEAVAQLGALAGNDGPPESLQKADIIIGTIADNQERKNLPAIVEAVHRLNGNGIRVTWILVTSVGSPYGWTFPHLVKDIDKDIILLHWGVSPQARDLVYVAADFIVLASEAEGACLPIYEAMAYGKTVIAPGHTAITEALENGRGILVDPGTRYTHPFGNVDRWKVDPQALEWAIGTAKPAAPEGLVEFIRRRPWLLAAQRLLEEVEHAKEKKNQAPADPKGDPA